MARMRLTDHDHALEPECASRRIFLRQGAMALLSLGFAPRFVSRASRPNRAERRKLLIVVFQRGAVDGLNMVVPLRRR